MKKSLPIGINTFKNLIQYNYVYVDKTPFIYEMTKGLGKFFLSRPRRFGKSLLVDTLKSVFEAKQELFQGLYIYDKWDWNTTLPVIRFHFVVSTYCDRQTVIDNLQDRLKVPYSFYDVQVDDGNLS